MYSKANYTIVGTFVLLFAVGLIWFALWLGKYGAYREFDTYRIEMTESVSGLSKDSVVKFRGVDIGRVSQISINPENIEKIEILVQISRKVPIKEDMEASVQLMGLTGLMSIEIDGGSNDAKTLQPTEEYVPTILTAPSLISLAKQGIGNLSEKATRLINQSQKLLTDDNIQKLDKILDNIEQITVLGKTLGLEAIDSVKEVNQTAVSFRESMITLTEEFKKLSTNISYELKSANKSLKEIRGVANPALEKLMITVKSFNRVTLRVEKALKRGDYNLKKIFEPVMVDIEIMSDQINDLMQQVERSPNDLLFKSRKPRRGPGE
ncbi:MAG: MCE family protein [Sulfurovum sp.]|nr:MCE family protein [Sulfurovum sp.]